MFRKLLLSVTSLAFVFAANAQKVLNAKDDIKVVESKDTTMGWVKAGGIGLDLGLLNLINPQVGAGDNRLGFGGVINYAARLKTEKSILDNKLTFQMALAKIGSDALTKSIDALQATSQYGHEFSKDSKWYGAGLADFRTQLLPTYGKNYLKSDAVAGARQSLTAKIFAPAFFRIAPGVIYRPNAQFKVMMSPVALKMIIVANDTVAKSSTFIPLNADGTYKKLDTQVGAEIRADYLNKFADGKIVYASTLDLYSNYLRTPQNIAIEWYNSLDFVVYKNISVNLKSDWFYDHYAKVYRGGDTKKVGPGVYIRNTVLLKYTSMF